MDLMRPLTSIRRLVAGEASNSVRFLRKQPGWLRDNLPTPRFSPPELIHGKQIEERAATTERLGPQPLWEGYAHVSGYPRPTLDNARSSGQVRSSAAAGRLFAWLARQRAATTIVEFGTAFGVSGMYWLAGLGSTPGGRLLTFEPNVIWADIARANLASVSDQFVLVKGTFEASVGSVLAPDQRIDIAFVDAIHTSEFVLRQFDILLPKMAPGGLILFDDIDFSADMAACWNSVAQHPRVLASAAFGRRLGIVELRE